MNSSTSTTGTDQYSTPKDNANPHAVKWQNVGQGGTTNRTVKIRAKGSNPNHWPIMQLWVNGIKRQQWTVNTTNWTDYTATVPLTGRDQIDIVFPNDNGTGGIDANLYIDWIQVNGVTYQENRAILDRGGGDGAFDGNDVLPGTNLYWNGALRFVVGNGGTAMGYDQNGNMSYKLQNGQATIYEWDHENRLSAVKRNGTTIESYLYDDAGQRVKKSAGGVDSYYVNQFYEVSGGVPTKYYHFGGQRVAMRKNGTLTYLHSDHLGSTVLETNSSGTATADQKYYAYGRQRDSGPVVTDHQFTGQKQDGTGLMYYSARYFDPVIGSFISPDTIVPDATLVSDYNRYLMTRGNPLKYSDPTGHFSEDDIPLLCSGCVSWDDVYAFFDQSDEILTWLQNPLLTFGSLLLAGDSSGVIGEFGLLLSGQHDPLRMEEYYQLAVWNMQTNQATTLAAVFANYSHITAWSTNSEVDYGGYFYTGLDKGFTNEANAHSWAQPWQTGFADLQPRPPSGNYTRYQVYRDVNLNWPVDIVLGFFGGVSTFYDAAALVNDIYDTAVDLTNYPWTDGRYPVIYHGSPVLGNRSLNWEIDRPNPY